MKLFAKITKVDVEKREVWGQAVAEVPDRAKEIFDYASSLPLFRSWSAEFEKATASLEEPSLGNIRAMHGKVAAGKVISFQPDDATKCIDIGTKIVDENEWQKCLAGVYTGFSIGGAYVKKWKDAVDATLTRYTASPSEISLVDLPCVPTAMFAMIKSATETEQKPFQRYGVLKAVIDREELTVGELLALTKEYLPDDAVEGLAKADAPLSEFREKLRELIAESPVEAVEAVKSTAPVDEVVKADGAKADGDAPAPAVPATPAEKAFDGTSPKVLKHLRKGMYSVQTFAGILQSLAWLAQDVEWEKGWEKDASTVPADLRTAIQLLCEIFKKMTAEETDEMIASILVSAPEGTIIEVIELAAGTAGVAGVTKAGKRHSAADVKLIQSIHDQAESLGAECSGMDAAKAVRITVAGDEAALSDLGKAFALVSGAEPSATTAVTAEEVGTLATHTLALHKSLGETTAERDELKKRVAFLEKQPVPAKGVVRTTVTKADDAAGGSSSTEPPAPDAKDPLGVMRKVHAAGGVRVLT